MQEESFEVQYTQEGERLDKVLSEIYPDFSRSFFQKLIKNKQIQVNGAVQKASYPVHTEDAWTQFHQDNRNLYQCFYGETE